MENETMKKEEFDKNCKMRFAILTEKSKRYEDSWRSYSIESLLSRARHRLDEVYDVFKDTSNIDMDNLQDAMNFCDFVMTKKLEMDKRKRS